MKDNNKCSQLCKYPRLSRGFLVPKLGAPFSMGSARHHKVAPGPLSAPAGLSITLGHSNLRETLSILISFNITRFKDWFS